MSSLTIQPISDAAIPMHRFNTLAEVERSLDGIDPGRIRLHPSPGEATKKDLLEVNNRNCELIDGIIVEKVMGFREGILTTYLLTILSAHVRLHQLGLVQGADAAVELAPNQVRIPDIAFYPWDLFPGRMIPQEPIPSLIPALAIEVLSISNTRREMSRKRHDYFQSGVKLVWEVDHRAKTISTFTQANQPDHTLSPGEILTAGSIITGLQVNVSELFAELD
jgi:Uma2 family endonuclease